MTPLSFEIPPSCPCVIPGSVFFSDSRPRSDVFHLWPTLPYFLVYIVCVFPCFFASSAYPSILPFVFLTLFWILTPRFNQLCSDSSMVLLHARSSGNPPPPPLCFGGVKGFSPCDLLARSLCVPTHFWHANLIFLRKTRTELCVAINTITRLIHPKVSAFVLLITITVWSLFRACVLCVRTYSNNLVSPEKSQ